MDTARPVVVIERTDADCARMNSLLYACGFRDIRTTTNSFVGLTEILGRGAGLVLADTESLPLPGLELLKRLRSDPALFDICFVLTSSLRSSYDVIEARNYGVDAFVLKPLSARRLSEKLSSLAKLQPSPERRMQMLAEHFLRHGRMPQDGNVRDLMKTIIQGAG